MKITIEPQVTQFEKDLAKALRDEIKRLCKVAGLIHLVRKSGGVEIWEIDESPVSQQVAHD